MAGQSVSECFRVCGLSDLALNPYRAEYLLIARRIVSIIFYFSFEENVIV